MAKYELLPECDDDEDAQCKHSEKGCSGQNTLGSESIRRTLFITSLSINVALLTIAIFLSLNHTISPEFEERSDFGLC